MFPSSVPTPQEHLEAPARPFNIAVEMEGSSLLIAVEGELDLYTGPTLREALIGATAAGSVDVTLDVSKLTFVDSHGLGVLVSSLKGLQALGGRLQLRGASRQVARTLRITGLDRVIPQEAA